jgi:acyl-CoA synthetase (NDP forming)
VPHLTDKTIQSIEEFVPVQGSSAKNPLDIMGAFFGRGPENLMRLMELLRDDPNIDALIFNQSVDIITRVVGRSMMDAFVRLTMDSMKRMGKPIYVVLDKGRGGIEGDILRQEMEDRYNMAGFATFDTFRQAAGVLVELDQYRQYLETRGPGL